MIELTDRVKDCLTLYRSILANTEGPSLYTQVEYILTNLIETEKVPFNTEFFSEEEVSQLLGVSRPTVNRAMKSLIEKGYLIRNRGKRAVTRNPSDLPLLFLGELISFGEMFERQKIPYSTKLLDRGVVHANQMVSSRLLVPDSAEVTWIRRIRFVRQEPILVVDSYFGDPRYRKLLEISEREFNKNLFQILREAFSLRIEYSEREVQASRMDIEDAVLLKTSLWEPCMVLRAVNFTKDHVPVEFFTSRLKGNRCLLQSKLYNVEKSESS